MYDVVHALQELYSAVRGSGAASGGNGGVPPPVGYSRDPPLAQLLERLLWGPAAVPL